MSRVIPNDVAIRVNDPGVGFDIHCHMFNYECVPNGFLGIRLPFTSRFMGKLEDITKFIGSLGKSEEITNASYFLDMFGKKSTEIRDKTFEYYPASTIFCPLLMDMENSIKGKETDTYVEQIKHMQELVASSPGRMLPFMALNPLNPNMEKIYADYFGKQTEFWGIKIYPSLGYLPSHPKLIEVFKDCAKQKIPVTAHCSVGTVRYNKSHHLKNIQGTKLVDGKQVVTKDSEWLWGSQDFSNYFNHPVNWEPVLEQVPDLILNLGHFGGYEQWKLFVAGKQNTWVSRIMCLMQRYENLYADFSYTLAYRSYHKTLKDLFLDNELIRNRLLYGSDYYMTTMEGHFREIKSMFEFDMGDAIMKQIAFKNPRSFLFK